MESVQRSENTVTPRSQRGLQHFMDVLRAGSEVQEHLRDRIHVVVRRIEQDAPYGLANPSAAWLDSLDHFRAALAQVLGQQPHLRRFPAAVQPLESDEVTAPLSRRHSAALS